MNIARSLAAVAATAALSLAGCGFPSTMLECSTVPVGATGISVGSARVTRTENQVTLSAIESGEKVTITVTTPGSSPLSYETRLYPADSDTTFTVGSKATVQVCES